MARWSPDARERLECAAVELFTEQGFAATTVPEITARAGLTTRTFFRHFADKREVLFADAEIPDFVAGLMADAPASVEPMALIVGGLQSVAETRFDGRRDDIRARRAIVRSDDGLRERELRKRAAMSEAIRDGFVARGVASAKAALIAEISVSVLAVSMDQWLDQDTERPLFEIIRETFDSLKVLVGALEV